MRQHSFAHSVAGFAAKNPSGAHFRPRRRKNAVHPLRGGAKARMI